MQEQFNVYKDIQARTGGDVYIGVVGPVRTGKSTFIKRFMDLTVLPNILDEASKQRAIDELPQSGTGKTITTTEPKFIPKEAVEVAVSEDIKLKVRLIDCVGYMVNGAAGHMENEKERLVKTPWFDYDIPFTKAADIGTKKVINDHSTIGIVVTTDGSIGEIPRENYIEAERSTIEEMKQIGKPFLVILNSIGPTSPETINLADELTEEYGAKVVPMNCEQLKRNDILSILEALLLEFPVAEICFNIPKWAETVENANPVKMALIECAKKILGNVRVMRDIYNNLTNESDYIENLKISNLAMDAGKINVDIGVPDKFYYDMLSELMGMPIDNEYDFINIVREMTAKKSEFDSVAGAIHAVKAKGYGSVTPLRDDIRLDAPEIIKHGNKYGIKIKAEAPSIHMIKANVTTEIAPIVGTEDQAKDLISYINDDASKNPENMWKVNIFGKTLEQMVDEGLKTKANKINDESQIKLQDTMEKIINESNGGMVFIII